MSQGSVPPVALASPAPSLSVVVCTYDRPHYLRKCLQSLLAQTLPTDSYEILVVDNGTDEGKIQTILDQTAKPVEVRYVREPRTGLSYARNTGWNRARGEYIAFIDDDALAAPVWLERILAVFHSVQPRPGCVGGRVAALWESPRPPWLTDTLLGNLSVVDWSGQPAILSREQWLSGCNMTIPRELLAATGGFSTALGRRGHKLLSMEETALFARLQQMGHGLYYHPDILVWHHIAPERLNKSWFVRRAFWNGVSHALARVQQTTPPVSERMHLVRVAFRTKVLRAASLRSLFVASDDPDRFALRCATIGWIGYVLAMLGLVK